ncbi:hypothetical protein ABT030_32310 [Streptomyces mirabilis]|uniref:hypothetical protein n=1 Tax=Streptomyces mirabilis TaxID=68239 RepID=UPI00332C335D
MRQTAPTPWKWLIVGISSKVSRRRGEDAPSAPRMSAPTCSHGRLTALDCSGTSSR